MTTPIKTYELHRPGHLQQNKYEIRLNDKNVYTSHKVHHGIIKYPRIEILSVIDDSILACAQIQSGDSNDKEHTGNNVLLTQGNPKQTGNTDNWFPLVADGTEGRHFHYDFDGKKFAWERSGEPGSTFRLVEASEGDTKEVLASIKYNHAFNKHGTKATIEVYQEMGQEAEVVALVAIMGAEERAHWSSHGVKAQASLGFGMPGSEGWIRDGF